jgi:hypothetical protein
LKPPLAEHFFAGVQPSSSSPQTCKGKLTGLSRRVKSQRHRPQKLLLKQPVGASWASAIHRLGERPLVEMERHSAAVHESSPMDTHPVTACPMSCPAVFSHSAVLDFTVACFSYSREPLILALAQVWLLFVLSLRHRVSDFSTDYRIPIDLILRPTW